MRIIGESHAELMRRYPGLYQVPLPPPTNKPVKENFGKKLDKFMVRHPGFFSKKKVNDAIGRLGVEAPVHFHAGKINRISLAAGDIFIQYNSSFKHNPVKLPQFLTGNAQFSSFTHGGLIVSNTELIHAGAPNNVDIAGETPLHRDLIENIFNSKREYHIFRPRNRVLASKMVEIATDLCENKYIPFAGIILPPEQLVGKKAGTETMRKRGQLITNFLKKAHASKSNRALFRFSAKARQSKNLEQLRKEYNDMIGIDHSEAQRYWSKLEDDLINEFTAYGIDIDELDSSTIEILEGKIRAQVETFIVKNYASKKHFFCSQFVAWAIQLYSCRSA